MRNKLILDFDGIFASNMLYNETGKSYKTFTWGIRHAIDMLIENGIDVYIISGDSTEKGQSITRKFCENLKVKEITFTNSKHKLSYLKQKYNLDECYYCGDDIYDVELFKHMYGITHKNTHHTISKYAKYVSEYTTSDYFFTDMSLYILAKKYNTGINNISNLIGKDCNKESLSDSLMDLRYKNIFILQQYSMRNHTDNKYNPLLDGNLNLTFNRIYNSVKNNPNLNYTITIPTNINESQYETLKILVDKIFGENRIFFKEIEYGINAPANYEKFSGDYIIDNKYDLFITYFANYGINIDKFTNNQEYKIIYCFNISKVKDLSREYIDKFFKIQYESVKSFTNKVYVLNQNQKDYFLEYSKEINDIFIKELQIKQNVLVDSLLINKTFLNNQIINLIPNETNEITHDFLKILKNRKSNFIFFPFRLSDKCYEFEFLLEKISKSNSYYTIFITDPNNTINDYIIPNNVNIYNLQNKKYDSKVMYLLFLMYCNEYNVSIPVFENPLIVMHQSILEMTHLTDNVKFLNVNNFDIKTLYDFNDITGIKDKIKNYIN